MYKAILRLIPNEVLMEFGEYITKEQYNNIKTEYQQYYRAD